MAQKLPKMAQNDARIYALCPQFFLIEKAVPQTFSLLEYMILPSNLMTCTPGYYANTFAPASTFGHPASTFGFFNQVTMMMGTIMNHDT